MSKKYGFTLAETLVVMVVLGVIAAILVPIAGSKLPNEEQLMFKKAYNLAGRVISELINDSDYYWESSSESDGEGFANTSEPSNLPKSMTDVKGEAKFCKLFAHAFNTLTVADCSKKDAFTDGNDPTAYTFKTNDGMVWQLPISDFGGDKAEAGKWYNIVVDVNGDKGGNCFDDGDKNCHTPDRFIIEFDYLGAMRVPGTLESLYLSSNKTTKRFKEFYEENKSGYKALNGGGVVDSLAAGLGYSEKGNNND